MIGARDTQFEGRTAEEAVARARAALGDSGALRCWKTRRGGVGGFFAREVFVAGLTPPPGSESARGRASRAQPGHKRGAPVCPMERPRMAPKRRRRSEPVPRRVEDTSVWPEDHLAGLVEATSDQVSLGPLAIPAEAFDEVLAEAQAALTREPRMQWHGHSRRPRGAATADCRPGGTRYLRASAPPCRREPSRWAGQLSRKGQRPEELEVARNGQRPAAAATRQEGDPTQGEDRTHPAD